MGGLLFNLIGGLGPDKSAWGHQVHHMCEMLRFWCSMRAQQTCDETPVHLWGGGYKCICLVFFSNYKILTNLKFKL